MRETIVSGRGQGTSFNSRARRVLLAAGMAAMASTSAIAASVWTGPGGTTALPKTGTWNTPGNWSPSGVPISGTTTELDFLNTLTGGAVYTSTDDIAGVFTLNLLSLNSTDT